MYQNFAMNNTARRKTNSFFFNYGTIISTDGDWEHEWKNVGMLLSLKKNCFENDILWVRYLKWLWKVLSWLFYFVVVVPFVLFFCCFVLFCFVFVAFLFFLLVFFFVLFCFACFYTLCLNLKRVMERVGENCSEHDHKWIFWNKGKWVMLDINLYIHVDILRKFCGWHARRKSRWNKK